MMMMMTMTVFDTVYASERGRGIERDLSSSQVALLQETLIQKCQGYVKKKATTHSNRKRTRVPTST